MICVFFITKRIDRLEQCLPADWGVGYENVAIGCTVETQEMADYRLPIFRALPIRHKIVICAPLLEPIDLALHLEPSFEKVSVGGESGSEARPSHFEWVVGIQQQCVASNTPFTYHQTGARLIKDGRLYRIGRKDQHLQARKVALDHLVIHRTAKKDSSNNPCW